MHILIISAFFAPDNQIASHRLTSFARHWTEAGHTVTVLTREPEVPGMEVPLATGLNVHRRVDPLSAKARNGVVALRNTTSRSLKQTALRGLEKLARWTLFPDRYILWALQARKKLSEMDISPDIVVTSVGPMSALLLGHKAAKVFDCPLVIDYRDLLTYKGKPVSRIRGKLEKLFEERFLTRASLISTVTEPMRKSLEIRFSLPALLVTNGYEPEIYSQYTHSPDPDSLHIVYTGTIYPRLQDPILVFKAVRRLMDTKGDVSIVIDFYGDASPEVVENARLVGVEEKVLFHGKVAHSTSTQAQINADLLLLLFWNDPNQRAVLTGKIFEYIGAQRPILCVGIEDGVGPDLIRSEQLGVVLNTVESIAEYLEVKLAEKRDAGLVVGPKARSASVFTRKAQSDILLAALQQEVEQ